MEGYVEKRYGVRYIQIHVLGCCISVAAGNRCSKVRVFQVAGASYLEVHEAGGGINYTVEQTRAASEDQLLDLLLPRLTRMSRAGTVQSTALTLFLHFSFKHLLL